MKKIRITAMAFMLLFGLMSQSFAELPANRIALGVQLGATFSQVKNVFGVPPLSFFFYYWWDSLVGYNSLPV